MIDSIIAFSVRNKLIIGLFIVGLIGWGAYSLTRLQVNAVPDITDNQVQVLTVAPTLAAQEVEKFITYPLEISMSNIPGVDEIRSISRFGLSVITVVFEEDVNVYLARQLVSERIKLVEQDIPKGFGNPELAPITTGLGEIYQYVLRTTPDADTSYSPMELRTIQDWIVKRQLSGIEGVVEVNSFGGYLKQYEVAINPDKLKSMNITIEDVYDALEKNNQNTGGSYIEKSHHTYFIRGKGLIEDTEDIQNVLVKNVEGTPVLIRDIGEVGFGHAPRFGAVTINNEGEVVGGMVLMLKGENSAKVIDRVKQRVQQVQESLPPGVIIEPFLDRTKLVNNTINTVTTNLVEGGLIVIFILVLLLGNFRAGLIVASVIPLSMLFAISLMNVFGVSANLMSLGAIDFGLIVDGSVIIVESIVHRLYSQHNNRKLTPAEMDTSVTASAVKIRKSAAFGEIIILIVYLPLLTLTGVEGKMFIPMAQTVSFAILGALILSLTYVPMMSALFLKKKIEDKKTISDRIMSVLHKLYEPAIHFALRFKALTVGLAVGVFIVSLVIFSRMGGEFIPTLEEGDFALHQLLRPGSSLSQSIEVSGKLQQILLDKFPEVEKVVTKIGSAEVPTDPMPIEAGDIIVVMKDKDEWVSAETREEMFELMEKELSVVPGINFEFTQPIQMRFNELMTGVRQDIAIKIYGENLNLLHRKATEAKNLIGQINGIGEVKVEQILGLPQIHVDYKREKLARYGMNVQDLNNTLRTAFAGGKAGVVFEGEKRFDLVVRLQEEYRKGLENIRELYITTPGGTQIPLKEVADVQFREGPAQISRDDTKRRITIGVNTRNRDVESLVEEIDQKLKTQLELPAGYYLTYGGQFENLREAKKRLAMAVPVSLFLIITLLYFTFNSMKQALLIFTAVPMAAMGGIFALLLRGMPFSISAGVGFIALFGVAVLNGIVLIAYFNQLKKEGVTDLKERILQGVHVRLRPVTLTAAVASLGFLPMALSQSAGAEVQRPLATVVIGGLITATVLTLVILPIFYYYTERGIKFKGGKAVLLLLLGGLSLFPGKLDAQENEESLTLDEALNIAMENHPTVKQAKLNIEQARALRKTAFNPNPTSLYYQREETTGPGVGVRSLGVQQTFEFPTVYTSSAAYRKENQELKKRKGDITLAELTSHVRVAFYEAQYSNSRLQLIRKLDSLYTGFENAASIRYETGETGKLEHISASAKLQQVRIRLREAIADRNIAHENLRMWLNSKDTIVVTPSELEKEELILTIDSSNAKENPILNYYRQEIELAAAEQKVEQNKLLPGLNLGYRDQQINGQSGFYAYTLGINIPLFFFNQQGKIQAAKIGKEIAREEYLNQELQWVNMYRNTMQEYARNRNSLRYYEEKGLSLAMEQIDASTKNYREGEISYVEYTQNVDQALEIREDYLNTLLKNNRLIAEIRFITGQNQ